MPPRLDTLEYYRLRMDDPRLSKRQREYARNYVSGVNNATPGSVEFFELRNLDFCGSKRTAFERGQRYGVNRWESETDKPFSS